MLNENENGPMHQISTAWQTGRQETLASLSLIVVLCVGLGLWIDNSFVVLFTTPFVVLALLLAVSRNGVYLSSDGRAFVWRGWSGRVTRRVPRRNAEIDVRVRRRAADVVVRREDDRLILDSLETEEEAVARAEEIAHLATFV